MRAAKRQEKAQLAFILSAYLNVPQMVAIVYFMTVKALFCSLIYSSNG